MILRLLSWQRIVGIAVIVALAGLFVALRIDARHWRNRSAHFEKLYDDEQLAFAQTTASYRAAADTARADDRANAARVSAEQQSINKRTADDLEKRLAAARLTASERLRFATAQGAADPRVGRATAVPGLSAAAGGTPEAAGDHGLPDPGVPNDPALIATEQAIQLDELIAWVKRQAAVDPNAPAAPR